MSKGKLKVFVTRPIPKEGIDILKKKFQVTVRKTESAISRSDLEAAVKKHDGILTILTDTVDAKLLDLNPNLRVVSNYAVGFDNIDVKAATERGVVITNTPGALSASVAEHAITLMLTVTRRVVEGDRFMRAKKYKSWMPMGFIGPSMSGQTVGIIGMGRIGMEIARIAHTGFGMDVLYSDIQANREAEKKYKAKKVSMNTVLKKADFVSLHVPLLPSTVHLIGAKELKIMKKTAVLINTARGPVIDEKALVSALKKGEILGAGLDVFEKEPKMAPGLASLENVVLTPHIASASITARVEMSTLAGEAMTEALLGKKPKNIVNPDVWRSRRK